jgi:PAS domain S-box-containing protein
MASKNSNGEPCTVFSEDLARDELDGLLRGLGRCAGQLMFAVDEEYRVVFINSGCETLLGYAPSELLGSSILELGGNGHAFRESLDWVMDSGSVEQGEFALRHGDGRTITFCMCFAPWQEKAEKSGVVGAGHNSLDWKDFEEDLARVDRLAEIGRMAAGIVHDLKNPLSVIEQAAGWAGVMVSDAKGLEQEDRRELTKTLQEIEDQIARSKTITDQVLDFVRQKPPRKERTNLGELVETVIRYMEPELKYPSIEVATHLGGEEVWIHTDAQLLQQVLVNILSNAVYAIREKYASEGRIEVRLHRSHGWAAISVTDNGTGIPKEKQERIFDLFFTTKPDGKGTGLGLPMCRTIAHKLGGELQFRTEQGKGTTFTVSLPAS